MHIFEEPIVFGRLLKRYQRFFIDVVLDDGRTVVAHAPNTGSMLGLLTPMQKIMLTKHDDEKRRCGYTAQAICVDGEWVGINTHLPNKLIKKSLGHPLLINLSSYRSMKPEMRYGSDLRSRIDFYFSESEHNEPPLFLEIKNVTLKVDDHAQFPDCVSVRAHKHIEDLMSVHDEGFRAACWFLIQRLDCSVFSPAKNIDKVYAQILADACRRGLHVRALCARIDATGLMLAHEIPCIL